MKKIFTYFSAAIFLIACAGMTGCNKNEPEQPAQVQTYHVSIQAGKNDANQQNGPRKALGLDGTGKTLTASWKTGEQVSVRNVTKNADLTGFLVADSSGVQTTISGELTGTINAGDELLLKFLSPHYNEQAGTLAYIELNCDYAVATIHVASVTWGEITFEEGVADFQNQQAIVKFTLQDVDDAPIAATELVVEVNDSSYTITPASATNVLFVALPGFSDQTVKLTATVGSETYTFTSPTNGVTFEDGKYYIITVKMAKKVNVVHPFSISLTQQIEFAHGNLQYQPSTGTWRIAREQYDFVGYENAFYSNGSAAPDPSTNLGTVYENSVKCNNLTEDGENIIMVDSSYTGWIDLFGWNTWNKPLNHSVYRRDYASAQTDFVDWGHNPIYDPKANTTWPADTWRTLTLEEYQYLLFTRTNASQLVGTASIDDHPNGPIKGIIILPDDFVLPTGLSFKGVNQTHEPYTSGWQYTYKESRFHNNVDPTYFASDDYVFNQNHYTLDDWSKLEAAGAVFLPAAGERVIYTHSEFGLSEDQGGEYIFDAIYVFYLGQKAGYWTSTRKGEDGTYLKDAYILVCTVDNFFISAGNATMTLINGQSVRLVRDL